MKKKQIFKRTLYLVFFLIVFISLSFSAYSAKFSPLVITSSNIENFHKLLISDKENSCVIIQVEPEELNSEKAEILMNWVRRGGTLWFYDSRLAHYFGMKPSPFKAEKFPFKQLEGEYGAQKRYPGIAVGCEAWGNHSITIGIRKLMVFVIRVGEGLYSAVLDKGGPEEIIPLLKIKRDDPYAIAAIKNVDEGKVIFKPLLWENKFDGADFQRKLIKYSSNRSVSF